MNFCNYYPYFTNEESVAKSLPRSHRRVQRQEMKEANEKSDTLVPELHSQPLYHTVSFKRNST